MIWTKVLWNIGKVIRLVKLLGFVLPAIISDKRLPQCGESVEFLNLVIDLADADIIDIPLVDDKALVAALKQTRDEFQCKV